jgi:hypothetical protein
MKTLTTLCILCAMFIPAALAQTVDVKAQPLTDTDIQLLRSNLQADKNEIVGHTMRFTDTESAAFWPLYRDYARDQQVIGDARLQLIKDYAKNYDTMDDTKAKDVVERLLGIDAKLTKLREDYWPKFEKALGSKRAARFYQVDNRLTLMINIQLASEIPLIP